MGNTPSRKSRPAAADVDKESESNGKTFTKGDVAGSTKRGGGHDEPIRMDDDGDDDQQDSSEDGSGGGDDDDMEEEDSASSSSSSEEEEEQAPTRSRPRKRDKAGRKAKQDGNSDDTEDDDDEDESNDSEKKAKTNSRKRAFAAASAAKEDSDSSSDSDSEEDDDEENEEINAGRKTTTTPRRTMVTKKGGSSSTGKFQVGDRVYATAGWYWSWGVVGSKKGSGSKCKYEIELLDGEVLRNVEEHCVVGLTEALDMMNEKSQLPRDWPPLHFMHSHVPGIQSMEEKERTFKVGTRVYAEFNRSGLFWATIASVKKKSKGAKRVQYKLKFDDGDESEQDASMMHSIEEALMLMRKRAYEDDTPPKSWKSTAVASTSTTPRSATHNQQKRKKENAVKTPRQKESEISKVSSGQPTPKSAKGSQSATTKPTPAAAAAAAALPSKKRPKTTEKSPVVNKKLESAETKESYFGKGTIVYAEFPQDELRLYYWGKITKKHKPTEGRSRIHYHVLFHDGDQATIDCTKMHSYKEAISLMDRKHISKDLPPAKWMEEQKQNGCSF